MKTLTFEVLIQADKTKVWNLMLQDKTYREWTGELHAGSYYEGSWNKGAEIRFLGPNDDGTLGGMYSRIKENRPFKFISIEHLGLVTNGEVDTKSEDARKWASAMENYTFTSEGADTRLKVSVQVLSEYQSMFNEMWHRALTVLKRICEREDNQIAMAIDSSGNAIRDGDPCLVVAGTHKGKNGTVEDSNVSKTGANTVTVREPNGNRFKTLAKNLKRA